MTIEHRPGAPPRSPRPGWYADPRGEQLIPEQQAFRWWDGAAWTAWRAESEFAPRPRGAVARVTPVPVLSPPRSPHWFLAVVVTGTVLVLLAILSVVGRGLPQESQPYLQAQPSPLGTPERIYRDYAFGQGRVATIYERLAFTLPQEVRLLPSVEAVPSLLRHATQAQLPVGADLTATLLVGDVEPDLVVDGDARASAARILPALVERYRQGGGVSAEGIRIEPWPQVPGAMLVTGYLRYASSTAGSAGDDLMMIVVPWAQGQHSGMGAWMAIVPETAPAQVTDILLREPGIRLVD